MRIVAKISSPNSLAELGAANGSFFVEGQLTGLNRLLAMSKGEIIHLLSFFGETSTIVAVGLFLTFVAI